MMIVIFLQVLRPFWTTESQYLSNFKDLENTYNQALCKSLNSIKQNRWHLNNGIFSTRNAIKIPPIIKHVTQDYYNHHNVKLLQQR